MFKEGAEFLSEALILQRVSRQMIWGCLIIVRLASLSPCFTRNSKQERSASTYIVVPIALTSKISVLSL